MKKSIRLDKKPISTSTGIFLFVLAAILCVAPVFGQNETTPEKKEDPSKKPAKQAFESPQLMDEQSVFVPAAKTQ